MRTWLLATLAAVVAALGLLALSVTLTRHALDVHAAREAALYARGSNPWQWSPRAPHDVIAGHAFGAATLAASARALRIRSRGDKGYAIGLPLSRPLDLRRFPRLRLALRSDAPFTLNLRLRQRLDDPLLTSASLAVAQGHKTLTVDLSTMAWHDSRQMRVHPTRAAMLRLRIKQAAGAVVALRSVAALPATGIHLRVAAPPDHLATSAAIAAAAATAATTPTLPVFVLPRAYHAEALLAQRDALRQRVPDAIVAADPGWRALSAVAPPASAIGMIVGIAIYAALLLLLWWRPPHRRAVRAMLELAACLLPPLAWNIGLLGTASTHAGWLVAVALALAFACALEWRLRPHGWRWLSADWRDWAWPCAPVIAALALLAWYHAAPGLPAPRHWLTYLLWAGLQQLLVLAVVARRIERLSDARAWAVLGAALAFALLHTPNSLLMELTFAAELWWAWWFLRRPVLAPVAVAHAIAALLLQAALSDLPLRSLEVGARFVQH